jgi:hypothetical protein
LRFEFRLLRTGRYFYEIQPDELAIACDRVLDEGLGVSLYEVIGFIKFTQRRLLVLQKHFTVYAFSNGYPCRFERQALVRLCYHLQIPASLYVSRRR